MAHSVPTRRAAYLFSGRTVGARMDADTATRADAVRFLAALAPDGALTFSTFTDGKRPARDALARIMHGDYWRHRATLATLNAQGAGVCVMVNRGDGKGRSEEHPSELQSLMRISYAVF